MSPFASSKAKLMSRASTAKQTAALLNAQSVHLDVLEVSLLALFNIQSS